MNENNLHLIVGRDSWICLNAFLAILWKTKRFTKHTQKTSECHIKIDGLTALITYFLLVRKTILILTYNVIGYFNFMLG